MYIKIKRIYHMSKNKDDLQQNNENNDEIPLEDLDVPAAPPEPEGEPPASGGGARVEKTPLSELEEEIAKLKARLEKSQKFELSDSEQKIIPVDYQSEMRKNEPEALEEKQKLAVGATNPLDAIRAIKARTDKREQSNIRANLRGVDLSKFTHFLAYMTSIIPQERALTLTSGQLAHFKTLHNHFLQRFNPIQANLDRMDHILEEVRKTTAGKSGGDRREREIKEASAIKEIQQLMRVTENLLEKFEKDTYSQIIKEMRAFRQELIAKHGGTERKHKQAKQEEDEEKISNQGVQWFKDFIDAYEESLTLGIVQPTRLTEDVSSKLHKISWQDKASQALGRFAYQVELSQDNYPADIAEKVNIAVQYFGGLQGDPRGKKKGEREGQNKRIQNLSAVIRKYCQDSPFKERIEELRRQESTMDANVARKRTRNP